VAEKNYDSSSALRHCFLIECSRSQGYNSADIATMLRTMDWTELFLDRDDQSRLTLSDRQLIQVTP